MRLPGDQKKLKKSNFFFQFYPHAGTVEENTWHFEVLLLFLSLRYGADLGRSRLVWFINIFLEVHTVFGAIICKGLNFWMIFCNTDQSLTNVRACSRWSLNPPMIVTVFNLLRGYWSITWLRCWSVAPRQLCMVAPIFPGLRYFVLDVPSSSDKNLLGSVFALDIDRTCWNPRRATQMSIYQWTIKNYLISLSQQLGCQ